MKSINISEDLYIIFVSVLQLRVSIVSPLNKIYYATLQGYTPCTRQKLSVQAFRGMMNNRS